MANYSTNLDEEFFHVRKWTPDDGPNEHAELRRQLRELDRLKKKAERVASQEGTVAGQRKASGSKSHFKLVALASLLTSFAFLVALLRGSPNSAEFPLTYIAAFFICFATAIALYAESRDSTARQKDN